MTIMVVMDVVVMVMVIVIVIQKTVATFQRDKFTE